MSYAGDEFIVQLANGNRVFTSGWDTIGSLYRAITTEWKNRYLYAANPGIAGSTVSTTRDNTYIVHLINPDMIVSITDLRGEDAGN